MFSNLSNKERFKISLNIIIVVTICALIIKFIVKWASTVAAISAIFSMLTPFFIGMFIAYLLHPLVKRFEKNLFYDRFHIQSQKLRQFLAILISYIIVIGLLVLFLFGVIPQIGSSLADLLDLIQAASSKVTEFFVNLEKDIIPEFALQYVDSALEQVLPSVVSYLSNLISGTIPMLYSLSVSLVKWVLNIFFAIVISCYILSDRKILLHNFKRILYAILSKEKTVALISTLKSCNEIFGGFIVGKFIDSFIIGVISVVALLLLKIPFAVLIGVIIGVTNMIPYFGPIIGAVPGFLILLISSPSQCILYLILVLCIQQFDGNILGPFILGDSIGIRPLWVIFAITVGGSLAGPLGMFLGVPLIAVIAFLANNWLNKRLAEKNITVPTYFTETKEPLSSRVKNKLFKKKPKKKIDK